MPAVIPPLSPAPLSAAHPPSAAPPPPPPPSSLSSTSSRLPSFLAAGSGRIGTWLQHIHASVATAALTPSHWLLLAAPVVVVSALVVAVVRCLRKSSGRSTSTSPSTSTSSTSRRRWRQTGHDVGSLSEKRDINRSDDGGSDAHPVEGQPQTRRASASDRPGAQAPLTSLPSTLPGSSSLSCPSFPSSPSSPSFSSSSSSTPARPETPHARLRLRVYHLRDRRSPCSLAMDDDTLRGMSGVSGMSGSGLETPVDADAAMPADHPFQPQQPLRHLPPLPPSTSSLAFQRQMEMTSAGAGAGAADESPEAARTALFSDEAVAAQMSFIHQPNPDYASDVADIVTVAPAELSAGPETEGVDASEDADVAETSAHPTARSASDDASSRGPWSPASAASTRPSPSPPDDAAATGVSGHPALPLPLPSRSASWPMPPATASPPLVPLSMPAPPSPRDIAVRGEIISVLDDAGAGWSRHTRVYGGGVCLACLAAENALADGSAGGMYGENVPMEERR